MRATDGIDVPLRAVPAETTRIVARSTFVALVLGVLALSAVATGQTCRLHQQASLSSEVRVDWTGWAIALAFVYLGLALIGSRAISRVSAA